MKRLTVEQKVKWLILDAHASLGGGEPINYETSSGEQIDEAYEELDDSGDLWDANSVVREGEVETGVETEWSRHYETKSVAAKLPDGEWVGWTYWYGGGKHGNPEEIDWISDAYNLTCAEEEKLVTVRTFSKVTA